MKTDLIIQKSEKIFFESKQSTNKTNTKQLKTDIRQLKRECVHYIKISNDNLKQILLLFNSLLKKIGDILQLNFPQNEKIKKGNNKLVTLIQINQVEPISLFVMHIYKYDDYVAQIRSGDENFFNNTNGEQFMTRHGVGCDKSDLEKIKKLFLFRSHWNDLTDKSRNDIKSVMKIIVELTDEYIDIKDDTRNIVSISEKLDSA